MKYIDIIAKIIIIVGCLIVLKSTVTTPIELIRLEALLILILGIFNNVE